jgi:hypothetical protein
MNDPEKRAAIEKTLSEIERAKADFPDLNIADFTKVWPREWVSDTRKGAIYGEVIKTLYDTAAFAVNRGIKDGRVNADQDLLMITNDADQLGMNRHYLKHYIEAEENAKESDAFIGTIRWGVDTAKDFPGYHVSQLFMQSANILATRPAHLSTKGGETSGYAVAPVTIGPNSAFRVSMYAAVGGVDDVNDAGAGADSELGRRVLAARGRLPNENPDVYGNGGSSYIGASVGQGTRTRVIKQVVGSDVDSAPGRLLDSGYRKGEFIPNSWAGFNSGSTRADDQGNPDLIQKEDARNNFGEIQGRVEHQITEFINKWYRDEALAGLTLSMLFPDSQDGGADAQSWTLKKDTGGNYSFNFTKGGATRFRYSLLRDTRSRFDPIANRLNRRVYGEVKPNAKRQPLAPEAPLVRAFS